MIRYFAIALVSLLILGGGSSWAANPTISVTPDSTCIKFDSSVVVTLEVSPNSTHLKAFSLVVSFDPTVIRTDTSRITEGPLLATAGLPTFFWTSFSPDSGMLYIDGAVLGDGHSVSGGGSLSDHQVSSGGFGRKPNSRGADPGARREQQRSDL